ncbi:MAG: winged helix-turn-helix transcriptional regulator [Anaerolineae bacterium]|nr:winged helix-turn-helix transcriptional regulator [Anaerolineae bacterium]
MPLEIIESTDPLTDLVRFQTSAVYEMLISLSTLLKPRHHAEWAAGIQDQVTSSFWHELNDIYQPDNFNGLMYFELAVDYPDHDDVPGFIDYVRGLDPVTFIFYVVGRVLPREQIAQTNLKAESLIAALEASSECVMCREIPLESILENVPAFQNRLADLWQWYWDEVFCHRVDDLRLRWQEALNARQGIFERDGGQGLWEYVTGKSKLPPLLPPDQPVTDVVFIPICRTTSPVLIFYGYGNVTTLFDAERTEARRAEIERNKQQALVVLKALGDSSRLDILQLIAHYSGQMHGKKIAAKLNLSASAVSRHLAQLKDAGLIDEESHDNRTITYRLQRDVITTLPDHVLEYLYH